MLNRIVAVLFFVSLAMNAQANSEVVFESGHASLGEWILGPVPEPADNRLTTDRISLGKALFFDPRLSGNGTISCGTCHNPSLGWSDGLPKGRGFEGAALGRATPTIVNSAYNTIQMWDGRNKDLEDQALGPMENPMEMNTDMTSMVKFLRGDAGYVAAFERAYPSAGIELSIIAKAIASYERTIISSNSPFDRWVKGDADAMNTQQINGFKLFVNTDKGNCAVCHSAPNFTDDGFHNLGLEEGPDADLGRFAHRPLGIMKSAFKTPTLRNIAETAPYFHNGTAIDLAAVVKHYVNGAEGKDNLSPNFKAANLSEPEQSDLVAFMEALGSDMVPVELPNLSAME